MENEHVDVFHLEDEVSIRIFLEREVRKSGLKYHGFTNLQDLSSVMSNNQPKFLVMNTVVRSYGLPMLAENVVPDLRKNHPNVKILFYSSDDVTAENLAEKYGAEYYCVGVSTARDVVDGIVKILRGGENGK